MGNLVKRFKLVYEPDYSGQMVIRPEGPYVLYSDYATLEARLAAVTAERDAARKAALDEAASACQRIAGNTADFSSAHRRAAGQCAAMILALKDKRHDA